MIDFEKELEAILKNDPLGLLKVKPKSSNYITTDERLAQSFNEINSFCREHGHPPEKTRDINERKLYSRLQGLLEAPDKAAALADLDEFGLLETAAEVAPKEISTIDDVLTDDALGLLGGQEDDIFTLKNISKKPERPEYTAQRKVCTEFEKFEPLFNKYQQGLSSGQMITIPFTGERQVVPGAVFVLQGMLVYVANRGNWEKKNFGNKNARLYCVFENATESSMYLRSLAAALWKTENSREVVDRDKVGLLEESLHPADGDAETGFIYVVRSLSKEPSLKQEKDLYKIGFSTQTVNERIKHASTDPTFLMADVMPVIEYRTLNLNPQKAELLLHTFFAEACLNIDVFDESGNRHMPREWFIVPLHLIEAAVTLLISGEIVNYKYDASAQGIVQK